MNQSINLIKLALKQIDNLGQKAFTSHEDCLRWKGEPDKIEITKKSVECKQALEDQHEWVYAILDALA